MTTRVELDHLEQANIEAGLQWLARRKKVDVLTDTFVRDLHKRLFGDVWKWAGTLRSTEKTIGIDPRQISVQLRMLLDDVRYWVENGTYSPGEAAVRFHHRMVFIHPFPNGNGRHARITADALLTKMYGTEPINWSGGVDLQCMNERRQQYILALRAADDKNYEPLLLFTGMIGKAKGVDWCAMRLGYVDHPLMYLCLVLRLCPLGRVN